MKLSSLRVGRLLCFCLKTTEHMVRFLKMLSPSLSSPTRLLPWKSSGMPLLWPYSGPQTGYPCSKKGPATEQPNSAASRLHVTWGAGMFIKALTVSGWRQPCRSAEGHTDARHLPRQYSVYCPCISIFMCSTHTQSPASWTLCLCESHRQDLASSGS